MSGTKQNRKGSLTSKPSLYSLKAKTPSTDNLENLIRPISNYIKCKTTENINQKYVYSVSNKAAPIITEVIKYFKVIFSLKLIKCT